MTCRGKRSRTSKCCNPRSGQTDCATRWQIQQATSLSLLRGWNIYMFTSTRILHSVNGLDTETEAFLHSNPEIDIEHDAISICKKSSVRLASSTSGSVREDDASPNQPQHQFSYLHYSFRVTQLRNLPKVETTIIFDVRPACQCNVGISAPHRVPLRT